MKKTVILIIFILSCLSTFSSEKEKLVKRNIAILPFININNVEEYDYLKETLRNALKSELIQTENFKITLFSNIDKIIEKLDYDNKAGFDEMTAIKIARSINADAAVIGKYTIIEDQITIQIDAVDCRKRQIAASVSIGGETGLDMFRIIDDASKSMASEMSKKLEKYTKSYLKIMDIEERNKLFTIRMKTGICLTAFGGSLALIGLAVFIYDMTAYMNVIINNKNYNPRTKEGYQDYVQTTNIGLGLLIASTVSMGLGLIMISIGIPLMIIEIKKHKKYYLSFNMGKRDGIGLVLSIKL